MYTDFILYKNIYERILSDKDIEIVDMDFIENPIKIIENPKKESKTIINYIMSFLKNKINKI